MGGEPLGAGQQSGEQQEPEVALLEAVRLGTPVLFDGVQPAAEYMAGAGAIRIEATTHDVLAAEFTSWADRNRLTDLSKEMDPRVVPTWASFAPRVAEAVESASVGSP